MATNLSSPSSHLLNDEFKTALIQANKLVFPTIPALRQFLEQLTGSPADWIEQVSNKIQLIVDRIEPKHQDQAQNFIQLIQLWLHLLIIIPPLIRLSRVSIIYMLFKLERRGITSLDTKIEGETATNMMDYINITYVIGHHIFSQRDEPWSERSLPTWKQTFNIGTTEFKFSEIIFNDYINFINENYSIFTVDDRPSQCIIL